MSVRLFSVSSLSIFVLLLVSFALPAYTQQEAPLKNIQAFPKDISRPELIDNMRHFSFGLGVRCQYCHTGGDGISFEGVVFENDDDPDKVKARFMIRMTEDLNKNVLTRIPQRDEPPLEITCKTCHRGQAKPVLLTQAMRRTLDSEGAEAAVELYRELREKESMSGSFDFGEWEVNTLGERLEAEGKIKDAIMIYELNRAFYPESISIVLALGRLYEADKDTPAAIRMYERALEIRPDNAGAKARLEALR